MPDGTVTVSAPLPAAQPSTADIRVGGLDRFPERAVSIEVEFIGGGDHIDRRCTD